MFRSDRIAPEWRYRSHSLLWRILCAQGGRFVGECRDQEKKAATFFSLDEATGRPLWEGLSLGEPWWVGLEGVQRDVVLFHTYAQPDMPAHRGVFAHDLESGSELWRREDLTYWFGNDLFAYVYKDLFEKRVAYELELRTGTPVRSFEDSLEEVHHLRQQVLEQRAPVEVLAPELVGPDSDHPEVGELVKRMLKGRTAVGAPEFIRHRDVLAVSLYTAMRASAGEKPKYENTLAVVRTPGHRLILSTILGAGLAAPVPDTFFIKGERLFAIQDQRELVAIRLWQS